MNDKTITSIGQLAIATNDIKKSTAFYKDVFDYGNLALLFAEGERIDSESNWNVLVSFFHASQIWPIITTSSTFEELKSSGELSLIRNIKLRNTPRFESFVKRKLNNYPITVDDFVFISLGFGMFLRSTFLVLRFFRSSSSKMLLHKTTHSSQMYELGPAINRRT